MCYFNCFDNFSLEELVGKTTRKAQPPARGERERGYAPLLAISTTVHVSHLHIHAYGRHVDAIAIWGKPSIPNIMPNSPSIQSFWPTAPEVRLVDFSLPDTLPFPFREMWKSFQTFSGLEPTTSEKHHFPFRGPFRENPLPLLGSFRDCGLLLF